MVPPNNWSAGGGSAWEWSHARKQFYFHRFSQGQPDLNWRNPAMEEAVLHVYAELARVDCLAGFMRLDLSKGTRDYQYHPDGPTARHASPVRGLGLTKSVSKVYPRDRI